MSQSGDSLGPAHRRVGLAFGCMMLPTCLFVAGCASPGTPRPPSLHLPEPTTDLTADRVGNTVHLRWTTSSKTTDGVTITGGMTAQVCQVLSTLECAPILRLQVHPGVTEAVETLPSSMASGPLTLVGYKVDLLNQHERSGGLSAPAFVAAGSAPPPVDGLRGGATAQGAVLQWVPQDASDQIELRRRPAAQPGAATGRHGSTEPEEQVLRVSRANQGKGLFQDDAGGTIDTSAKRGQTYLYTAQRVRSVVLAGHRLELSSAPSKPLTIVMRDIFPPRAPAGLEAIANSTANSSSIDLSWQPGAEADLAGYRVYRQEGAGRPVLLTPELLQAPGYRDTAAASGHSYVYTVTAVDAAGNESAPTAGAKEELRVP